MKCQPKRILSLLLVALLFLMALPMHALASPDGDVGWTQYGKAGHATASGDTVSFQATPPTRSLRCCSGRPRTAITARLRST